MNILFCGDKKIEDGILISVLSLLEHVTEFLSVYVLTVDIEIEGKRYEPVSEQVIKHLDGMVKRKDAGGFVKRIDTSEAFLACIPFKNMKTRFTPCCMLRLFADEIVEIPDRILYLDSDVVCRGDITAFYYQDIENYELAGALDYYGRWFFRKRPWQMDYLNSGVLLLNMKKIRENGLFEKSRVLCREKKMFMPDQSAINKLVKHKKIVSRKYNEQRKLRKDTVLQHFTTSFRFFPCLHTLTVKPWQIDQVHEKLGIYEYDEILYAYQQISVKLQTNNTI